MKQLSKISALLLLAIMAVSCSKDKKIEKNLYSSDGVWNIDQVEYTIVENGTSGQGVGMGSSSNVGTFTFDKKDKGSYEFSIGDFDYSGTFSYTVEDGKITASYINQSFSLSNPSITQEVLELSGVESGDDITLTGSRTSQALSGGIEQNVLTADFVLSKK